MTGVQGDRPTRAELEAEIELLKRAVADRDAEIERLKGIVVACCPWWEQRWHRPH